LVDEGVVDHVTNRLPSRAAKHPQGDHDGSRVQSSQSRELGVQVPRRVHVEVSQEAAVRKIKRHLGQAFHDLARRRECRIEEEHLMPDHIHILISIPPKYSVAQIIGYMKGKRSIWIAQNIEREMRNFLSHQILGAWMPCYDCWLG
jgi:hypothetical protein